jgi:hypothetical protein
VADCSASPVGGTCSEWMVWCADGACALSWCRHEVVRLLRRRVLFEDDCRLMQQALAPAYREKRPLVLQLLLTFRNAKWGSDGVARSDAGAMMTLVLSGRLDLEAKGGEVGRGGVACVGDCREPSHRRSWCDVCERVVLGFGWHRRFGAVPRQRLA